jgi:hypothetical protein
VNDDERKDLLALVVKVAREAWDDEADEYNNLSGAIADAVIADGYRKPSSPAEPRRRQRIAVLGAAYSDAHHEAAYLPPEADVVLLSACARTRRHDGHGEVVDALFITPSALVLEAPRIERLLPSLRPMFATRKLPKTTAGGGA